MIATGRAPWLGTFQPRTQPESMVSPASEPIRWRNFIILFLLLPLFGEVFHYMKAVPPMWALSKAFPILSLPLCFFVLKGDRPVGTRQLLLTLLYMFLVPSFTAIYSFQQNFFLGLTSQVKLLPIIYFFSFTGLMRLMKPSATEISKSFLWLSFTNFAILLLLWAITPQSAYESHYDVGDSPIFSFDSRGNRIRMPLYFGIIGIFYCYRRFFANGKWYWLLGTFSGFGLVLWLVRARSEVLGLACLIGINAVRMSKPAVRVAMVALLPFAFAGLLSVPYVASVFSTDASTGFDVRRITIQKTIEFLGNSPVRWAIGVGSLSPLDPGGMIDYFNHFFFLADITWLGVVFEFGIIGAVLLFFIPARGVWESRMVKQNAEGAFLGALQDYLIYAILISPLYPLTLSPGEFAMILAVLVYEKQRIGVGDPRFNFAPQLPFVSRVTSAQKLSSGASV